MLLQESRLPTHHPFAAQALAGIENGDLLSTPSRKPVPIRESGVDGLFGTYIDGERTYVRTFIRMCAIHATITTCIVSMF